MTAQVVPPDRQVAPVRPPSSLAAARLEKTVSADAVRHNLAVLRAAAGGRGIMPVLKGDAYGLGAPAVAGLLVEAGVQALAVDTVAEGAALREHGVGVPILVMDVDVADTAEACARYRLMPAVAGLEQVARHAAVARRRGEPVTVWLRTNVGFNRFGPREERDAVTVLDALHRQRAAVRVAGVFAHLSSSARDAEETAEQAAAFRARVSRARAVLGRHLAASLAATHGLLHPAALAGTDWVRPGIGLYGLTLPDSRGLPGWAGSALARLRPAVTVRARVLDLVTVTRPEGLGYDRSVALAPGRRLATVAIGFSRGVTGHAPAFTGLLRGRNCPMVGRPGMDCAQFDVTEVPQARPGDWMTLIGRERDGTGPERSAGDVAAELGLTLYELLAALRMPVRLEDHAGTPVAPP
ncbi:alanine racemase [Streptomyces sp. Go40/10]|uniref:alanine racemase n=1 Tax=Streptomyces sp. Go40/10 TaxID=2825844 RepID=UPI001E61BC95|nr:alanine racemase [Streptomyces sp. Go40/10]UFR03946.1 alanine racemase [Streptomyces sp. Go40/10]